MSPTLTFALAGNPNSGKTTLFNSLTGARQHVGNYPGVTVEKREGRLRAAGRDLILVDLPGMYSLTAYCADERAARSFLVEEKPSCVIDVVDAGTLERGLYLTVQLLELGAPVVLALNMMDEVRRRGLSLDTGLLARLLGLPVVATVARLGQGTDDLVRQALEYAKARRGQWKPLELSYGPDVDRALGVMAARIEADRFLTDRFPARWLALKYLEADEDVIVLARGRGPTAAFLEETAARLARHIRETQATYPEAVISDYRYGFIAALLRRGVLQRTASPDRLAVSDTVDRVLTHAVAGPLIMLAVLFCMFQLTFLTSRYPMDWLEAGFGWLGEAAGAALPEGLLKSLVVSGVIAGVGGVLGFVPLICVMFFLLSCLEDLGYTARMAYMLDRVFRAFGLHGASVMPFIISGGIPGGCAVPGVMAARTLRSPKERLATILSAPFMACGAKIPVYLLLIAAFFPEHPGMVMFGITVASWAAALCVAKLWRATVIAGHSTPFLMELPPYRLPTLRGLLIHTGERAWQYIKKAGTIVLAISVVMWAAMTFPGLPPDRLADYDAERAALAAEREALPDDGSAQADRQALGERLDDLDNRQTEEALRRSLAGRLGVALESLSRLAGFDWRVNIALIGGLAAKEVVVSTLGTAYDLGQAEPEAPQALSGRLAADPRFTPAVALALIAFTILYAPCFVTVAVMARETNWKWAAFAVVANTALGFAVAVAVFQIARIW
ncbi:MAG: ferrous iron transport protein B [Solidesulfovibrio sp. DCME]|uniref:ferrous iron transport protein B n=1 Tax=Solidesulfovibrio sp. DCME TaxID=3447380 RepID=UPI003D113F93